MTQAVCIVCGAEKHGAWTQCPNCGFRPETVLELVTALAFSEKGQYRSQLGELPRILKQQIAAIEKGIGSFAVDTSMAPLVLRALKEPSFRDMLTLTRVAKNGLFAKRLNLHEIGPDSYASHVLTRGRDMDKSAFDAIRCVEDGDLYVMVVYENGDRQQRAVPKDQWYAAYDMMILTERAARERTKLQKIYEGFCECLIEQYLASGTASLS